MNALETQLRSLRPRDPSPRLDRRLFGIPASKPPLVRSFAWLAPAAACMLLITTFSHQQNITTLFLTSECEAIVGMSLSNQSYAAYLPGSFKQEQNRWDTFEWTKGGDFNSSMRLRPQGKN